MPGRGASGSVSMSAKSSACHQRAGKLCSPHQSSEVHPNGSRTLGAPPAIKLEKLVRPKKGDLRELVLPGGGDLCLRVWAGMRRKLNAIVGWHRNASTHTPAFKNHLRLVDEFLERKHYFHRHAWDMLDARQALRLHAEFLFVLEDVAFNRAVDATDVFQLLNRTVAQAKKRGKAKLAEQRATHFGAVPHGMSRHGTHNGQRR